VAKIVETLQGEPNVFFFVSNEYTGPEDWFTHQVETVRGRCAELGCDLLTVSMVYRGDGSTATEGISCGTASPCLGSEAFRPDGRPVINQRDTSRGTYRPILWSRFMDGVASAGTRDDYSGATLPETTFTRQAEEDRQLRRFVDSLSSRPDELVPGDDLCLGTRWSCRANPGTEIVGFSESSRGWLSVDLSGEGGTWSLSAWDVDDPSAGPEALGSQPGGAVRSWSGLGWGDRAFRLVMEQAEGSCEDE
jgi:hypothetical protein